MAKNQTGAALGLVLLLILMTLTGCMSPQAKRLEDVHLWNAETAAEHNARMRCLEQAKAKAYTAYDESQAYGGKARDYATPSQLDPCTNISY
jgi:Tfp pilus assembly protein PilP